MKLRLTVIAVACLALAACGRGSRLPEPKPTALGAFTEQVTLKASWNKSLSSAGGDKFSSLIPAVAADQIIVATSAGTVAALGKNDGAVRWSTASEGVIASGVGQGDGVAVVVSEDRIVTAVDSATGELRWNAMVDEVVFTPPLVHQGVVVLRSISGRLYGLNADDGRIVWDTNFDQPDFVAFGSPRPIALGNTVIVGNADGRIVSVDLNSGFEAWQIYLASERSEELYDEADSIPVIVNDRLFVADLGKAVVAYNLRDGNVLWEHRRAAERRISVAGDAVVGFDANDRVFGLSADDGTLLWTQDGFLHRKLSNIAASGQYVILDDKQGYLHVLDSRSGDIVGRAKMSRKAGFGGVLVDGDRVYVSFGRGAIGAYALQPAEY